MPTGVYARTPETRAKMSARMMGNTWNLGNHHPEETKAKMSASRMGRVSWNKGIPITDEVKGKISTSLKAKGLTGSFSFNWKGGLGAAWRRHNYKRRALGSHSLNSWFEGCEGHHINLNDVIYIPVAMHDGVKHNIWTGRGMEEINALAGQFLTEDWT